MTEHDDNPGLIAARTEQVRIEDGRFLLHDEMLRPDASFGWPDEGSFLWSGECAAVFVTGGNNHLVDVRIETWSLAPPKDSTDDWDGVEEGLFTVDSDQVYLESSQLFDPPVQLPASGTYHLRAYSRGRDEAAEITLTSELLPSEFPAGLEQWLVQLWLA